MLILVFFGTIRQGELGLYLTQKIYFSSLISWIYFIPIPGGRFTMFVMFINLFSFLFRKSLWKIKKIGILIVHSGALLLLIGGGLTAYFSSEGRMTIKEGEKSNYIQDYYDKEFSITSSDTTIVFDVKDNSINQSILIAGINFNIDVLSYFDNSNSFSRVDSTYKGYYRLNDIISKPSEKEFEMNNAAIIYKISGISNDIDGIYANTIFRSHTHSLDTDIGTVLFSLRPKRTYVPFSIELIDFIEELHPGTTIAKSYSSEVMLHVNDTSRRVVIEMNEPLRYNEYTFFQSSFNRQQNTEFSTFAVVKNYGKLFPYISSIMMCIGLLTHLIMMLTRRIKK